MLQTPLSERLKIVLVGRRNVGKSSLINHIANKPVAIVSEYPGTTTDPVSFPMELGELGPVVFVDTAGLDDQGDIGKLRIQKTYERLNVADIILFVTNATEPIDQSELDMLDKFSSFDKPLLIVLTYFNGEIHQSKNFLTEKKWTGVENKLGKGIDDLKNKILQFRQLIKPEPKILDGLVTENDFVVLVTPIDFAAPKGRLILPQVETLRELLDRNCGVMVVKETELKFFYNKLGFQPRLVITDSQAFHRVAEDIPENQLLTSFSILMARKKGNLLPFIKSLQDFKNLKPESKILILEICSHHRQPGDIGTVKIPYLLKKMINHNINFEWKKQISSVDEIKDYSAVIICGGCMVTSKQYKLMMDIILAENIPLLNYGIFFAWVNGLLPRAIEMFPDVLEEYLNLYGDFVLTSK